MPVIVEVDTVATPSDLSPDLLTSTLKSYCSHDSHGSSCNDCSINAVTSLDWKPLGRGVLSNVQILTVQYEHSSSGGSGSGGGSRDEVDEVSSPPSNLPLQFLVKFRKPEIPLPDLFSVEGRFYQLAEELVSSSNTSSSQSSHPSSMQSASQSPLANGKSCESSVKFPFRLAKAFAFGSSWLLLEYIPPKSENPVTEAAASTEDGDPAILYTELETLEVFSGCPPSKFDDLLLRLSRMHSLFWVGGSDETPAPTALTAPLTSPNPSISSTPRSTSTFKKTLKKYAHQLSSTPGVGHSLPPSVRHQQFASAWPAVRERLLPFFHRPPNSEGKCNVKSDCASYGRLELMDRLVEWTSQSSRIEKLARRVAEKRYTLIHGDFHVGNMLFPKAITREENVDCGSFTDGTDAKDKTEHQTIEDVTEGGSKNLTPWLVDFSMAGIGNPLIDVVFFLVVGANSIPIFEYDSPLSLPSDQSVASAASVTSEVVGKFLKQYYDSLVQHMSANESNETNSSTGESCKSDAKTTSLLPWDEFLSMFRQCLLNQFIILICYDSLCRTMADDSSSDKLKRTFHAHFDRVNARCVRMLLSEYGWREDMLE